MDEANVRLTRTLVTTTQQNDQCLTMLAVVQEVTAANVKAAQPVHANWCSVILRAR